MTAITHIENAPQESSEDWSHAVAREARAVLRVGVIVMMFATVVTMFVFPFWGIFPAIGLLGVYALLLLANAAERRSRSGHVVPPWETQDMSGVDADETASDHGVLHGQSPAYNAAMEEIPFDTIRKETITFAEIFVGLAVAAVILCALLFHWSLFLIAALFIFPYMFILLAPVWLGWLTREMQEEKLRHAEHAEA